MRPRTSDEPRVGVMMCAYHEERFIVPSIKQFEGTPIERVSVAVSKTPWFGEGKPDRTAQLALENGATVKLYDWKTEADQKNYLVDSLADMDWILMFAPDMYMTREDITKTVEFLKNKQERAYGCKMYNYWKQTDTIILPNRNFNSLAIKPSTNFTFSAIFDNYSTFGTIPDVTMYHLSWYRTDEEVKTKISTYSHANEIRKNWFKDVWKSKEKLYNFGPTNPSDFQMLEHYGEMPQEIKDLLVQYKATI